jgi:hypothetical protein
MTPDMGRMPYYNIGILPGVCHQGQRKLFYSELEYLTMIASIERSVDFSNFLIVYIGASPGVHLLPLMELFPTTRWLLYDRNPSECAEDSNRVIFINEYMDDNRVAEVLRIANGREIIYITDIRINTQEDMVFNDMIMQQRWGINMHAKYMLIKYRPPYIFMNGKSIDCTYDYSDIEDKITIVPSEKAVYNIFYLTGDIMLQLYPPKTSSECRLFVTRRPDGKYDMQNYDYGLYEEQCAYFTAYVRRSHYKYGRSDEMIKYLLGYDDSYESVSEYYICYNYNRIIRKYRDGLSNNADAVHIATIRLLHKLNLTLIEQSKQTPITIAYHTYLEQYLRPLSEERVITALYGAKVLESVAKMNGVCDIIQVSANLQLQLLYSNCKEDGAILSKDDIDAQYERHAAIRHLYIWQDGKLLRNVVYIMKATRNMQNIGDILCKYMYKVNRMDEIKLSDQY